MGNMRFKVGDRVRIKSLDWYNKNKNNYGAIYAGNGFCFWKNMSRHCGKIMKITIVKVDPEDSNKGFYFMENSDEKWTDGMIEGLVDNMIDGLVEEMIEGPMEKENESELIPYFEEGTNKILYYKNRNTFECYFPMRTPEYICPDGYIFKDEEGNVINAQKIVLEKKKKEYPKTFEECCKILGLINVDLCFNADYRSFDASKEQWKRLGLMNQFYQLLICRDAYWKIAGEEMGLGKPWEPDYTEKTVKYCLRTNYGRIVQTRTSHDNHPFSFPTEEMRDAFYENFKEEIEICKELL